MTIVKTTTETDVIVNTDGYVSITIFTSVNDDDDDTFPAMNDRKHDVIYCHGDFSAYSQKVQDIAAAARAHYDETPTTAVSQDMVAGDA